MNEQNLVKEKFMILDGNSLTHRAFHAINSLTTSQGVATNAVYGFTNMLLRLIEDEKPDYLAVAFDKGRVTFRHTEFADYKAQRAATPEDLRPQFALIKQVLRAMGIPVFELDDYEADDLIGTLTLLGEKKGMHAVIVSGDKDMLQLVDRNTNALVTRKGITDLERYDLAQVAEKYGGLTPQQLIDVKALQGDVSDNIPGIPSVGPKTAVKLIQEFGSVEELLKRRGEVRGKLRGLLDELEEQVIRSKWLATIVRDAPIKVDWEQCLYAGPNFEELIGVFRELEFRSLIKRLAGQMAKAAARQAANPIAPLCVGTVSVSYPGSASSQLAGGAEGSETSSLTQGEKTEASGTAGGEGGKDQDQDQNLNRDQEPAYRLVRDEGDLKALAEALQTYKRQIKSGKNPGAAVQPPAMGAPSPAVAIYLDSGNSHRLREEPISLSLCWEPARAWQVSISAFPESAEETASSESERKTAAAEAGETGFASELREQLKFWLKDPELPKVFHDAKAALLILGQLGLPVCGIAGDTLLEAYLTNPGLAKLSLEDLALQYLNQLLLPADDLVWSGCRRAEAINDLHQFLLPKIAEAELEHLYREVELPLVPVLAEMEKTGVYLDAEALEGMSKELGQRIEELTQEIYLLAGEEFNVNSTRQLGVILFEKLGLPVRKKTKTGYSTDAEVLEELADLHPIIGYILEHRQLVKLKSTYVDGMRHLINPRTGKVHTTFNQAITATGRLSSTEPNLQNIPIRLEYGRKIRKFFAPSEPGWLILAADYSQIDLRALAHISGDAELIKSFQEGGDIHTHTAAQVFGIPEADVTKEMRYRAKAVNFGIVYGMSDFGLAKDLKISRTEAREYIDQYFATYHGVRAFMDRVVQEARDKGYVTTLLGRRRYLPEIFSSNRNVRGFGERAALNTPIQGTASDIIKVAMLKVAQEMKAQQLQSRMLLQVHDELIFEVPPAELIVMTALVKKAMENAVTLRVPLTVNLEAGPNWYDLKSVDADIEDLS